MWKPEGEILQVVVARSVNRNRQALRPFWESRATRALDRDSRAANFSRRKIPVWERGSFANCSGVPSATIAAAMNARFRAEIDDVIRGLDDIQVVFDDDQGVAAVHQLMKKTQKRGNIVEMQTGRRFVENQESVPAVFLALRKVTDELQTLRFTSG